MLRRLVLAAFAHEHMLYRCDAMMDDGFDGSEDCGTECWVPARLMIVGRRARDGNGKIPSLFIDDAPAILSLPLC